MKPVWIKKNLLIAVHDELIAEHGGLAGIRDENALDSALNAPQQLFYYESEAVSLELLAARYASSLTRNHPFVDGNKRTAFFACLFFLEGNGVETNFPLPECILTMIDLSVRRISEDQFSEWLSKRSNYQL